VSKKRTFYLTILGNSKRFQNPGIRPGKLPGLLLLVVLAAATHYLCKTPETPGAADIITIQGKTMGTYFLVKIVRREESGYLKSVEQKEIKNRITGILATVNHQMSTFQADSEISRFNKSRGTDWIPVSTDTALVISESLRISRLSRGAFDITVGPLIELWGFGRRRSEQEIPGREAISKAKKRTGYQKLTVRREPAAIRKSEPELSCNLSAIAKGFGVDRIADYFNDNKIRHYLVDIGGEIRVRGYNQSGHRWTIGIAAPRDRVGIQKTISLVDQSIATSGDYRNYYEKNGVRYSHTINPRTGKPVSHSLASVSILHESCMLADAFATAISVLGPEKGYKFALRHKLPVYLIIRKGDHFIEKMSESFRKRVN
jgi:thiamine biosynthesis lipoprotein